MPLTEEKRNEIYKYIDNKVKSITTKYVDDIKKEFNLTYQEANDVLNDWLDFKINEKCKK